MGEKKNRGVRNSEAFLNLPRGVQLRSESSTDYDNATGGRCKFLRRTAADEVGDEINP